MAAGRCRSAGRRWNHAPQSRARRHQADRDADRRSSPVPGRRHRDTNEADLRHPRPRGSVRRHGADVHPGHRRPGRTAAAGRRRHHHRGTAAGRRPPSCGCPRGRPGPGDPRRGPPHRRHGRPAPRPPAVAGRGCRGSHSARSLPRRPPASALLRPGRNLSRPRDGRDPRHPNQRAVCGHQIPKNACHGPGSGCRHVHRPGPCHRTTADRWIGPGVRPQIPAFPTTWRHHRRPFGRLGLRIRRPHARCPRRRRLGSHLPRTACRPPCHALRRNHGPADALPLGRPASPRWNHGPDPVVASGFRPNLDRRSPRKSAGPRTRTQNTPAAIIADHHGGV